MAGELTVGQLRVILEADSSRFAAAMKHANADSKKLAESLKKELEPSARGVNAAFKQFLGTNEIRRAQEMAAAVQKLGGVTKLTEADQRKLNTAVNGAIAHYKALGTQAPANLLAIQKATAGATQAATGMGGAFKTSFATLTASFTAASLITKAVTGLVDLGLAAVKSAGQIVDLSKKTGLSISGVQRLGFVAQQSGGSVEQMADAVFKTGINIEKGGTKTKNAIDDLGLSFAELKAMKPEEQFDAIMRALAAEENQSKRNLLGVQLMGKAYANVAASVDGYVEALKNAPEANADAIRATDAAANAIGRAWSRAEKVAINAIGNIVIALEQGLQTPTGLGIGAALQATPLLNAIPLAELLGRQMKPARSAQFGKDTNLGVTQLKDYTRELREAQEEVAALTKAERAQITAALKLGESTEDIATAMDKSDRSIELFKDSLKGAGKEVDAYRKKIQEAASVLTGDRLRADVKELADTLKEVGDVSKISGSELFEFAEKLDAVQRRGGTLTPELQVLRDKFMFFKDMVKATRIEFELLNNTPAFAQVNRDAEIGRRKDFFQSMRPLAMPGRVVPLDNQINLKQLQKPTEDWGKALEGVIDSFEDLASIAGDTFSDITRGTGSAVSSAMLLHDGFKQLGSAKTFAGTLTGIASIIGGLGQAIELGKLLHDALTRTEGEKSAADIRRGFGAFDADLSSIGEDDPIVQQITALVKRFEVTVGQLKVAQQLTRGQAADLLMPELVKRAGGIDASNFEGFAASTNALFDAVTRGGEIGEMALKSLDEMFGLLGDHVVEQGGLWDANFIAILRRAQAEGLKLASVMELVKGQLDISAGGLGKVTGGFASSLPTDVVGAAGPEADTKRKAVVQDQQDDFDRLSRIALATFNAYIANGQSAADAIAAIGPSIDTLKQATTDFGFAGNEAFNQLSRWRDLVSANQPLLDSLGGLNEMMMALANVGALDTQTFADMQAQGASTFEQLTAAGFTQNEALAQMAPMLQTILKLHEERGLAIDDETQALIDQARESGALADETIDKQEVQLDLMAAMVTALGGTLPESWRKFKDAAVGATNEAAAGVDGLTDKVAGELGDAVGDDTMWQELERQAKEAFDEAERLAREAADGVEDAFKDVRIRDIPINFDVNRPDLRDLHVEVPGAAEGAFVKKRPGGSLWRLGEGAHDEWVIPDPDFQSLIADWNAGPSLPSLSMASSLSGAGGHEQLQSSTAEPLYLMVDSRVLGEVSARTDSRAASRFGLMRS